MNVLEYKNYHGSVEVDIEGNVLYGKVLGLGKNVLISYEGRTVSEFYQSFKDGVDAYLGDCVAAGIEPEISFGGVVRRADLAVAGVAID